MAINPSNKGFKKSLDEHYVDKTGAIAFTNSIIDTDSRFVCVARPRRFGKTLALLSLIAYYSKGASSGDLFSQPLSPVLFKSFSSITYLLIKYKYAQKQNRQTLNLNSTTSPSAIT